MKHTPSALAALAVVIAAASCSADSAAPSMAGKAESSGRRGHAEAKKAAPAPMSGEARDQAAPGSRGDISGGLAAPADGAVQAIERKIVKTGEFQVTVKDLDPALALLSARLQALGGFVSDTNVYRTPGAAPSARVVIKVPGARFDAAAEYLRGLGEVTQERVWSEDVTDQFYDLDARIGNQRRTEVRLIAILDKQAGKLHEVLEVEREISRVRENLERLQGQMKLLSSRIELSTITLNIATREEYRAKKESSFGDKVSEAFGGSWRALVRFVTGIVFVIVVIIPWLTIPAALLVLVLVMKAIFVRKRKP